ncbi:zinc finger protein 521-like [Agrilus planipennis]|uniref:Zinc finger protein 521-like n=1 Tax=Agrilus planipennis TaxID=224129 RepID=A0A1W4X2U4_AGRPL|nr:zinc finger protein 521-like [Agrilus planipennis]
MISQNSCIICQKADENLTDVFLKKEDITNLKQQLSFCVPEINWNCSEVPPYVCELCVAKLNVAVDFRQKCLEKYESLTETITPEIDELKTKLKELEKERLKTDLKCSDSPCKLIKRFSRFNIGNARGCYSCNDCRKNGSLSVDKILSGRVVRKRSKRAEVLLPLVQDKSVNVSEDDLLSSIASDTNEKLDFEQKLIQYYKDTADGTSSIDSFDKSTTVSRCGYNYINPFVKDHSKSATEQILQDLCTIAFPLTSMRHIFNLNRNYQIKSKRSASVESSRKASLDSLSESNSWKYCTYKNYTPSTYSFKSQRSQRSYLNERTLKCNICGKEYKFEKKYAKHMLDKHGIQNEDLSINSYSCPNCNLKFYTQTQLDRHAKIHSQGATYKCDYCERCFVRQVNLHKHMRSKHDNDLSTFGDKNREKSSAPSDTPKSESQKV